jgi:two-component system sensor histidine kinase/response regulator
MMNSPEVAMASSYDYRLVAVSVLIAVMASYAALDLAGRVTSTRGVARRLWLSGGAVAMGTGIWAMHYVGMLAFRSPAPVEYDWPTVLLSWLAAIFASAIALFVVSREEMGLFRAIIGSIFMGTGIAGMHYIGMAAMRLPANCQYSRVTVAISVALAMVISLVALWLTFHFRAETKSGGWRKALSAVVMGAAVPVMHYTGMAAASFTPAMPGHSDLVHALSISSLGVVSVILVTFMVLGLTVVTSLVDRRFSAQALELRTSEKRYRQILATSFDAFVEMDSLGRITDWNVQAERIFGWARAEMIGENLPEKIIPALQRDNYQKEIRQLLAQGQVSGEHRRFEIAVSSRDGGGIPAEITISAMWLDGVHQFAAFVRDLSERKRFEQDLHDAKEAAEVANQAKSTFLATMSHEIRTPMNGILGMTDLVLDTKLTEEQREHLGLVKFSAESLLTVINDILDFSKIEAGKLELESIPFELRESLGETMKALGFRAHQKQLELVFDVRPEVPEALLGDPGRIRQILINLVGNAIKFTERGEIVVSVDEESGVSNATHLHFAVRDTGVGIAAEKQGKIFEAFAQADGSMARKYGGTGLGLTICKRLAELMAGRVWMESQPGQGSTFHFVIRVGLNDAPVARCTPAALSKLPDSPVLIVDDNLTNRRVLDGMLVRWGMRPTAVESGRAALQALREAKSKGQPFPLVLLDGQMPEMDGFALAEIMHQDAALAGTMVMMLTSAGSAGDGARCRELGISAYLAKPIRQGELLEGICALLERSPAKKTDTLVTKHTLREVRNRRRVLLAEDNMVNQKLALRLLEKRGYEVIVAGDGQAALGELQKGSFDVILMDVQMPKMDGLEATAAIREKEKSSGGHIPIIAMTAHSLKGDEERCVAGGMDAYVSKPIRTHELFATIERVLGKSDDSAVAGHAELQTKLGL